MEIEKAAMRVEILSQLIGNIMPETSSIKILACHMT